MPKQIRVEPLGFDTWGRPLYQNVETLELYVMVDGQLHTATDEGEPMYPLRGEVKVAA